MMKDPHAFPLTCPNCGAVGITLDDPLVEESIVKCSNCECSRGTLRGLREGVARADAQQKSKSRLD